MVVVLKMKSIWRCPHCFLPLEDKGRSYNCANNHCFDLSKEGYLNLLPVNKKSTQAPGDTKAVLLQRRLFLEAGYYESLANALLELVDTSVADMGLESATVLDCGCGEGYYSGRLASINQLQTDAGVAKQVLGVDISKAGIQMSAKRYKDCRFAVGSNFSLPVIDSSVDILIRNFAPSDDKELNRVLKPQGYLIVVVPGQKHLEGLRSLLYKEVEELQSAPQFQGFELKQKKELTVELSLTEAEKVEALFSMTPFYWKLGKEFNVPKSHEDTAHFNILVFQKGL